MLVIGFGGGVAVEAVPDTVRGIDVIELEPEIIEANKAIAKWRMTDPLTDKRLKIINNDARSALMLTTKRYDVIVSQPSHPWTAGASHLYTREFIRLAREHLRPDGVFVQWMNVEFVDQPLFKTLGATLFSEFQNVRLYRSGSGKLLFLASNGPLDVERQLLLTGEPLASAKEEYARLGIDGIQDVAALLAIEEGPFRRYCGDAPLNTDDRNRLAVYTPRSFNKLTIGKFDQMTAEMDALVQPDSGLHRHPDFQLDRAYIAQKLWLMGMPVRAEIMAERTPDPVVKELALALTLVLKGNTIDGQAALDRAYALAPDNQDVCFKRIEAHLEALARGEAPAEIVETAARLKPPAKTVVDGWRLKTEYRWRELSELDSELARVPPNATCFRVAVPLRAMWRLALASSRQLEQAEDAIKILDRSLALTPDPQFLQLRINAGIVAGRPEIVLETISYVINEMVFDPHGMTHERTQLTKASGRQFLQVLDRIRNYPGISRSRFREVWTALQNVATWQPVP
jgi:tetratricopeptide (TPR) repeat protein